MSTTRVIVTLAALVAGIAVFASEVETTNIDTTWGPSIGSQFPHDLQAPDHDGIERSFDDLKGRNGVAVIFIRSLDWCPYCKGQVIELNTRADDLVGLGFNPVTVSYDSISTLASFGEEFDIRITMLSDPDSEIIDAMGIRDGNYGPDSAGHGIPRPGIVLVGADGIILKKIAHMGYKYRPSSDSVVQAVIDLHLE